MIRPLLDRRRSFAFIAAVTLPAIAVPGADIHGQTSVSGVASDQETKRPLPGVLVSLVDTEERTVARALSGRDGRYLLRSEGDGPWRVSAGRIGYASDALEVVPGSGGMVHLDLVLRPLPIALDPLEISVATLEPCGRLAEEERSLLGRLWVEAGKALEVVAFTAEDRSHSFVLEKRQRAVDVFTGLEAETKRSVQRSSRPYESVPVDELLEDGWIRPVPGVAEHDYFAPDAAVILSEPFRDAHCFYLKEAPSGAPRLGLGFEPLQPASRGAPGIRGVLWLEMETAAPRSLEFAYTRHYHQPAIPEAFLPFFGGEVTFRETDTGSWIVDDWVIRMPQYRRDTAPPARFRPQRRARPTLAEPFRQAAGAIPDDWLGLAHATGFAVWEQGGSVLEVEREATPQRSPRAIAAPTRTSRVLFPVATPFDPDRPRMVDGLTRSSPGTAGAPGGAVALQTAERRGVNFMIGGGIAVVVGSLVDGDGGSLIVLGGLVAAGYGLYLYLDP